jgi:hypothetical protein
MSPAEKSALETYQRCADRCVELSAENKRLRDALEKTQRILDETARCHRCKSCALAASAADRTIRLVLDAALAAPEAKESK